MKELRSSDALSRSSKGTTKQEMPPQIFSTTCHDQSKGLYLSMDTPLSSTSCKGWFSSMKMIPITLPHQPWSPVQSPSSLLTLTSSCHHTLAHHTHHTQDHHHPPTKKTKTSKVTTGHTRLPQKPYHNQEPFLEMNGSVTCRG